MGRVKTIPLEIGLFQDMTEFSHPIRSGEAIEFAHPTAKESFPLLLVDVRFGR